MKTENADHHTVVVSEIYHSPCVQQKKDTTKHIEQINKIISLLQDNPYFIENVFHFIETQKLNVYDWFVFIKDNNINKIKLALENDKTIVNATDTSKDNWTALHYAARNGNKILLELLLENGAEIGKLNDNHCTPMHLAAMNGDVECFKLLADKSSEELILLPNKHGVTALAFAVAVSKSFQIIKYLLEEKKADVTIDIVNSAVYHCQKEIIDLIISKNADIIKTLDKQGASCLYHLERSVMDEKKSGHEYDLIEAELQGLGAVYYAPQNAYNDDTY